LIVEPAVLLLDEPLGALDLKLRRQMQDELKAIQKRVGTAFVHVTHDQEEAMALADHVVVMNNGCIEDEGAPERVYGQPSTRFSATFMGESTILSAEILPQGRAKTALGIFELGPKVKPGSVHLAIRPEHISFGGDISARIKDVIYQGSFKRIAAIPDAQPDLEVLCRVPSDTVALVGQSVMLRLANEKIVPLRD
jgi:spermidine/putrescine transport system ATP-binding protein